MNEENKKFISFITEIKITMDYVADAFETGHMSDAKASVYRLSGLINELNISEQPVSDALAGMADNCWQAIAAPLGPEDPYQRAQNTLTELKEMEKYLQKLVEGRVRNP